MNEIFKDITYLICVFVAVWIAFYLGTRHDTIAERTARYDCTLADFQARVPEDIREECRRIKLESINKQGN